jgi:magnesium chelatase family protein
MVSKIRSLGLGGISGYEVSVECYLSGGLPCFEIVGLPDTAVKEARERVRAAVKNCGVKFPVSRITVNLAPANTKNAGTVYDLPVMLGILAAAGYIEPLPEDSAFFGELSLSGELRPVTGALPMALAAERIGIPKLFVPADNAPEAAYAAGGAVYPVSDINQLLNHLNGTERIAPVEPKEPVPVYPQTLDFSEVKGQDNVKRALEVAAAGGHNHPAGGAARRRQKHAQQAPAHNPAGHEPRRDAGVHGNPFRHGPHRQGQSHRHNASVPRPASYDLGHSHGRRHLKPEARGDFAGA